MINVDVIRAEPPQAVFACPQQVISRRTHVIGSGPNPESRFRRNQEIAASPCNGFPQDLLRKAVRIDVRSVEQVDACFEANIHKPGSLGDVAGAPGLKELIAAPKGTGPKAEDRHL